MADWKATLLKLAPTVATALGSPLAGVAIKALGDVLGVENADASTVAEVIASGKLTPEQVTKIKELELQYQNEERERGFRYADLAVKDRDSARRANVEGGTQKGLFWLSLVLLVITLGTEVLVLFVGYPATVPEIVVGRVLGLLDAVAMMVLTYWYGTTNGSSQKNILLAQAEPPRR